MTKWIKFVAAFAALNFFVGATTGAPKETPTIELGRINITDERVDDLVEAVNGCYPEPSWIERSGARIDLKAQAGYRRKSKNEYIITDGTSNFLGLSITLPLYNAQDIERDRTRELSRRQSVAEAVGQYINALGGLGANRSFVTLQQNQAKWVQARVDEGIAPTSDYMETIKSLASEARTEIKGVSEYHASRARLLALCPSTRRGAAMAAMRKMETGK